MEKKSRSSAQVKSIALKHQEGLAKKSKEIQAMLITINNLIKHCQGDERPECPILDDPDRKRKGPR